MVCSHGQGDSGYILACAGREERAAVTTVSLEFGGDVGNSGRWSSAQRQLLFTVAGQNCKSASVSLAIPGCGSGELAVCVLGWLGK